MVTLHVLTDSLVCLMMIGIFPSLCQQSYYNAGDTVHARWLSHEASGNDDRHLSFFCQHGYYDAVGRQTPYMLGGCLMRHQVMMIGIFPSSVNMAIMMLLAGRHRTC